MDSIGHAWQIHSVPNQWSADQWVNHAPIAAHPNDISPSNKSFVNYLPSRSVSCHLFKWWSLFQNHSLVCLGGFLLLLMINAWKTSKIQLKKLQQHEVCTVTPSLMLNNRPLCFTTFPFWAHHSSINISFFVFHQSNHLADIFLFYIGCPSRHDLLHLYLLVSPSGQVGTGNTTIHTRHLTIESFLTKAVQAISSFTQQIQKITQHEVQE